MHLQEVSAKGANLLILQFFCRVQNRSYYMRISAAPADMSAQRVRHFGRRRMGIFLQQGLGA